MRLKKKANLFPPPSPQPNMAYLYIYDTSCYWLHKAFGSPNLLSLLKLYSFATSSAPGLEKITFSC